MARLHHQPDPSDVFAGVDWGGTHHQLCLVDADGQVLLQRRVPHTVAGIAELCRLLTATHGLTRVAIERAEGLLVERLLTLDDVEVFCVSPKISSRARERYRLAATKTDEFDAFVLADTLRHEHGFWRPLRPASDTLMQLRATIGDRERVVWNQRDLENQLRATMEAYNPAVLHLFSSLDRDISLEFVRRYPLPAQTGRIGVARMGAFISREHPSSQIPVRGEQAHAARHRLVGIRPGPRGSALVGRALQRRPRRRPRPLPSAARSRRPLDPDPLA